MFDTPVTHEKLESLRTRLSAYVSNWDALVNARRKMAGDDIREACDLMHLLLCYNLPGLPGYLQGADVPGMDIHSLKNRELLMGRYFPFAVKQGLSQKVLPRENIFF